MRRSVLKRSVIIILLAVITVIASVQPGFAEPVNKYEYYKYETLTDLLGVTRSDVVEWLSSHEDDDYYLGTPYAYRTGDIVNEKKVPYTFSVSESKWGLWPGGYACYPYIYSPNGDVVEGGVPQMNCGGFVHHVLTHAANKDGTEDQTIKDQLSLLERMYDSSGMGFAGACSIYLSLYGAGVRTYCYRTIDSMLEDEILEKGDLIIFAGIGYYGYTYDIFSNYSDWHIGFFWGDESDENLFWHSTHQTLGRETITRADGTVMKNPAYIDKVFRGHVNDPADKDQSELYGNIISEITPTSEYVWAIVVKLGDDPEEDNSEGSAATDGGTDTLQMGSWWLELNGLQMLDDAWYHFDDLAARTGWKLINGEWYYFDAESSRSYYLTLLAEKNVLSAMFPGTGGTSLFKVFPVFLDKTFKYLSAHL